MEASAAFTYSGVTHNGALTIAFGATETITLANQQGVTSWALDVVGYSGETVPVPTIVFTSANTATITAPADSLGYDVGWLVRSIVNDGLGSDKKPRVELTSTAVIGTITYGTDVPIAAGETIERGPRAGWVSLLNRFIRDGGLSSGDEAFSELMVTGGLSLSITEGRGTIDGSQLQNQSWHVVADIDFTALGNIPMLTDGDYNLGLAIATKIGSFQQQLAVSSGGIISGVGLALPPNSALAPADNWARPSLVFKLRQFYPTFSLLTPVRASFISGNDGNATNDVSHALGIGVCSFTPEITSPPYTRNEQGVAKRMSNSTPTTSGVLGFSRAGGATGSSVESTTAEARALNQFRVTSKDGIAFGNALIEGSNSSVAWDMNQATLRPIIMYSGYGTQNNNVLFGTNLLMSQLDPVNAFVEVLSFSNGAAVVPPAIKNLKIELFY